MDRRAIAARLAKAGPGGYGGSYGAGAGGTIFADAFGAKIAPTPRRLVETYKSLVYACSNLNALGVARTPLRLYAASGGSRGKTRSAWSPRAVKGVELGRLKRMATRIKLPGGVDQIDEITDHPLLDCWADPNPYFDSNLLTTYLALCLDVVGQAYFEPVFDGLGLPTEIWPLPSQDVIVVPRATDFASIDHYQFGGMTFAPDELVRIRNLDLRNPYLNADSPARAAFQYAGLEDKWVSIQDELLSNGPRPGMLVSPKNDQLSIGAEEARRLESDLNQRHSAARQGRAIVARTSLDYHPLTYPPGDLSGLEISDYDLQRIANCFGVPIGLLKTDDVNLANAKVAHRQHAEMAVEPRCILIAGALTKQLARRIDPRLFFAFDDCCSAEQSEEAAVRKIYVDMGALTINDVRPELGYDAVPWGDEPWMPSTLRQPSEERVAPPAPPGGAPGPGATPPGKPEGPGEDDAEPTPDPASEPDPGEDAEKALRDTLQGVLTKLGERLDADEYDRPRDGDPGDVEPEVDGAEPPAPGGGEHVWASDGDPDREATPEVVPPASPVDPGDAPLDRDGVADALPAPGELRRPDGVGDDAADRGVLAGVGDGDVVPDSGEDGPGDGPVEGDRPPPGGEGEGLGPELLPGDEPDDEPEPGEPTDAAQG